MSPKNKSTKHALED